MSTLKVNTIEDTSGGATTLVSAQNTAKAWVDFDGGFYNAVGINNAYNVSSITDNGAGDYTLTFTNSLATPYVFVGCPQEDLAGDYSTNRALTPMRRTDALSSASCRVRNVYWADNGARDMHRGMIVIFGD